MKIKLGRLLGRLFRRKTADGAQDLANAVGRPDIAAGIQVVEDAVDVAKGKRPRR